MDVVVHTFKPSCREAEVDGSFGDWGQRRLYSKFQASWGLQGDPISKRLRKRGGDIIEKVLNSNVFKNIFSLVWEFHTCIQLILIFTLHPFIPPLKFMPHSFKKYLNESNLCWQYTHNVRPSTRAWSTYQGPHSKRKLDYSSPSSHKLSVVTQLRMEACEPLFCITMLTGLILFRSCRGMAELLRLWTHSNCGCLYTIHCVYIISLFSKKLLFLYSVFP